MPTSLTRDDAILVSKFRTLQTGRDVAALLEVSYSDLTYHLYRRPLALRYKRFSISKKTGSKRIISAPVSALKILQKKLNYILQMIYTPKACVHGFVRGRSVLTNAQTHVRRGTILNIDLYEFFPSINFGRVRGMFMAPPYNVPEKAATVLAQLCCFDGHLPQGAPTSPVVSNMVCGKLDSDLFRLARRFRCTYCRYADDITFSTTRNKLPSPLGRLIHDDESTSAEVGELLRSTIENNGFHINFAKTRIQGRGTRKEVTGLVVNRAPNVQRKYVRQLRAVIYAINKFGFEAAESEFQNHYYRKQLRPHPNRELPSLATVLDGRLATSEW